MSLDKDAIAKIGGLGLILLVQPDPPQELPPSHELKRSQSNQTLGIYLACDVVISITQTEKGFSFAIRGNEYREALDRCGS